MHSIRWMVTAAVVFASAAASADEVAVYVRPPAEPGATSPERFAADEIAAALARQGDTSLRKGLDALAEPFVGPRIVLATGDDATARQAYTAARGPATPRMARDGFSIRFTNAEGRRTVWIFGEGQGGLMYGGLETAEQIRLEGLAGVELTQRNPHLTVRGVKFNLPLDGRTPGASDLGDSARRNLAAVWEFDVWTQYLDALAHDRYNVVSLWNPHPFPSLVKVSDYPDVAQDDVLRSTVDPAQSEPAQSELAPNDSAPSGPAEETPAEESPAEDADARADFEVVLELSIDEKIDFWRRVMEYAQARNIEFHIVATSAVPHGAEGKHGVTATFSDPATTDYFKRSATELLLTYPLLAGVGFSVEADPAVAGGAAQEAEMMATFGEAALEVARAQPERGIRLFYQGPSTPTEVAATWGALAEQPNIAWSFGFAYGGAHVLSTTSPTFHAGFAESLGERQALWSMQNDDVFHFRWGAPDFVRELMRNVPVDATLGMLYGSGELIWGREPFSKSARSPRQLEIDKHWYDWMLWGRLSYDPRLPNPRLVAILGERFPGVSGQALFSAWQNASMVYPLTSGMHWNTTDAPWALEANLGRPATDDLESGFHDVNRFIAQDAHPGTDILTIPRFITTLLSGSNPEETTPLEVAAQLHRRADAALAAVRPINAAGDEELAETLLDIASMATLGKYYAHKIEGATELAFFRRTGIDQRKRAAAEQLEQAQEYWNRYTTLTASRFENPIVMSRVGKVDWERLNGAVARDIAIAREAQPGVGPR